ncbi:MAG: hypothetical protein IJ668_09100 [Selenomonadaceae bacterium]|nr:hypothetical protein [Selenomonadaceae bacterium]
MIQWFLALRDVHNLGMSADEYGSMFKPEFLNGGFLKPTPININDAHGCKRANKLTAEGKFAIRKRAEGWSEKLYPKTIEENKKILDDYLTLCEAHNIRPIMFFPPNTAGYIETYPKKIIDEFNVILRGIMSKHQSAVFFNGWQITGLTDEDFQDSDHLNVVGAAKFSSILNDFIMQFERK